MPRLSFLVFLVLLTACSDDPGPRRIAVTLDDAPIVKPLSYADQWERLSAVDTLIEVLNDHQAPTTIFVIGSDLENPDALPLLNRWTEAGARVANHSLSHRSFNDLPLEEGAREIAQAQARISRVVSPEHVARFFRFPFLEKGRTAAERDRWQGVLDSLALKAAPATITTDDWRFDNQYAEAELAEDWDARYRVGQEYLAHVKESVQLWDRLGTDLYGRNVSHVLMLHANRINRDYLDEILAWLRAEGFEFISLEEAYRDPLYREETTWLGASGVSLLEQIKQTRLAEGRAIAP